MTIEAATEIWSKLGIPMKSSWLHLKELRKIFKSRKKLKKVLNAIITPKETTEKDFVEVWERFI